MELEQFLGNDFWVMTIRIFIAALLCGFIGLEREIKKHPAGFRTHLLVGVGSCLMMLLSLYGFQDYIDTNANIRFDPARIPSYVISGIGFLGTGTILVKGVTVHGLTTAASIWVVAGIGLIVGVGMIAPALLTTTVVLLSLIFLNKFEKKILSTSNTEILTVVMDKKCNKLNEVLQVLEENEISFLKVSIQTLRNNEGEADQKKVAIEIKMKDPSIRAKIQDKISTYDYVQQVY